MLAVPRANHLSQVLLFYFQLSFLLLLVECRFDHHCIISQLHIQQYGTSRKKVYIYLLHIEKYIYVTSLINSQKKVSLSGLNTKDIPFQIELVTPVDSIVGFF